MLDIPVCQATSTKRNANDLQVKQFIKAVPVKFNPGPKKTNEEGRVLMCTSYGSSSVFLDPSEDVSIVEDENVEKNAACDLCVSTSKGDRGPSALQRFQSIFRDNSPSVPSSV